MECMCLWVFNFSKCLMRLYAWSAYLQVHPENWGQSLRSKVWCLDSIFVPSKGAPSLGWLRLTKMYNLCSSSMKRG
jgi:hypothetical protein